MPPANPRNKAPAPPAAPPETVFSGLEPHLIDALMEIEVEAYPDPWTRGMFIEEMNSPRSRFWVMFVGGELVGYGGFWLGVEEIHITSVTVRQDLRGHGLGRRMLHHLLEEGRRRDAASATLEVRESNRAARELYLSEGFETVGRRKRYYPRSGEDAIVMRKELGEEA